MHDESCLMILTSMAASASGSCKLLELLGLDPVTHAPTDLMRGSNEDPEEEGPKLQDPCSSENSDDDKDANSDAEDIFIQITPTAAGDCTMQGQRLLAIRF